MSVPKPIASREERVGIRELRQNLSKYLRSVEQGKTFRVSDRGRPVAILAPLPEVGVFERMVAQGLVTLATRDLASLGPPPAVPTTMSISEALAEQRREKI